MQTLPGVSACECRVRCLANTTCRGYGTSDATQTCLLAGLLPTPQKMEASSGDWRWHARTGVRLLDEPCEKDADCSLLVPGAVCVKNICQCRAGLQRDDVGGCRKAGSFVEVTKRRLTSSLLSETPQTYVDACKAACVGNLSCVAVEFSASERLCRMYAEGVTNEATSGGDVQTFVWSFARADGTPPDTYQQVGNSYLRMLLPGNGLEAADACFRIDSAIMFPEVTEEGLSPLRDYIAQQSTTSFIWIGMEDMLEEGQYMTSDGGEMAMTDINWDKVDVNPNGFDNYDCAVINRELFVHDAECMTNSFNTLCQYVGENLALYRRSWMNAPEPKFPPSNGNDGNINNYVHTPLSGQYPTPTWTVDLGGSVQVSSILYVARVGCCAENRNRLTEIRVGSDPARFDDQHSARCAWLEKPFVAKGYARLFRCAVPLTGRYVRLIRDRQVTVDFAEFAVFGNRLQY